MDNGEHDYFLKVRVKCIPLNDESSTSILNFPNSEIFLLDRFYSN